MNILGTLLDRLRVRTIHADLTVLALRPGDTLVLRLSETVPVHVLSRLQAQMAHEFRHVRPDVKFAVIGNGMTLEVVRPTPHEGN